VIEFPPPPPNPSFRRQGAAVLGSATASKPWASLWSALSEAGSPLFRPPHSMSKSPSALSNGVVEPGDQEAGLDEPRRPGTTAAGSAFLATSENAPFAASPRNNANTNGRAVCTPR